MARIYVGPVSGLLVRASSGLGLVSDPSFPFNFDNLGVHAEERPKAMDEIVLDVAYFKATGKFGSGSPPVSYAGARYQDCGGCSNYVQAHRAVFNVKIWDKNIADFAESLRLKNLVIAPQAVTDALPPPANYGDRLVEIISAPALLKTVQRVAQEQEANGRVNFDLVLEATEKLHSELQRAYEQAIDKARAIRQDRGWSEHLSLEEAAKALAERRWAGGSTQLASQAAQEVDQVIEELRTAGPQSPVVDERMRELKFQVVKEGPSRFGDLVDIYLTLSMEHAMQHPPGLLHPARLEEACARLDDATAGEPPRAETAAQTESSQRSGTGQKQSSKT